MHQIKKLELVGFKSFCDRTQIVFGEGTTSIVGPNGCGKSNIADAIAWVVGEQSAKSLRTDRMEGVIFNGTQTRKPTGLAEVVLTLSLQQHPGIPDGLDLNPEGFTVGRRLYRSGESEYLLDGRRCRLKDVQALFEGTGLGPNSYALIEQGRIGQILSSKPADRRGLIEEAARITLFKSRRYSAETKIELARQNLLRVNDIIREVSRQLNSLRRQAAKARRYGRLREELRSVHRLKLGIELRQLTGRLDSCGARLGAAQAKEQEVLSALAGFEEKRVAAQETCRAGEEAVDGIRDRLAGLRVEAGDANSTCRNQEIQRQNLEDRIRDLERGLSAIEERKELIEREQKRLEAASSSLSGEIAAESEALEREQARSEALQGAIRDTERGIDEIRTLLINRAGKISDLKNLQVRCQENLLRISARAARLENERERSVQERNELHGRLSDLRRQAEAHEALQKEVAARLLEQEQRAARLADRIGEVAAELTARQDEYSTMQHRFTSLEEVERRRSNYSEGVQKFLSSRLPGEEGSEPRQTLADRVETDPAYETAVEGYLNDPLQYILVGRLDDAVESVHRLKRLGAGKCTFLALKNGRLEHPSPPRPMLVGDGIVGYLDSLLKMQPEVREAFERALPGYAATVMVEDLETAFRTAESYPEANFLTLSGEAYCPRGTLSAAGQLKSMSGFLALKREKRELQKSLQTLGAKVGRTREESARLREEQASAAALIKSLATDSRKIDIDGIVLRHEIARLEGELGKIDQAEHVTATELSQLRAEKSEDEERLAGALEAVREIDEERKSGEEELRESGVRLESLKSEHAALSRALSALISSHAAKEERLAATKSEQLRLSREAEDVHRKAGLNQSEREAAAAAIEELKRAREATESRIAELAGLTEQTEAELSSAQRELAARREALARLENESSRLHSEREEAMELRNGIEIEKARLESDLQHLERSCVEEYHVDLAEVVSRIDESEWQRSHEDVSGSYDELRTRLENFGAINMRALEEYQELEERYQFLTKQRADIEQSIADTQQAISEMNRRSIEQFRHAFTHIREYFMEVFQILFKGGQCDLRLLDEGDLLESGVDIVAQPPGKKLQNVLLLSGGEKALTALALLIAIFRYRPSPFCVLDEVDAPLDDANVVRFTQLIDELSRGTQFILITHNKKTMQIARTLYGVTMEEPGISKIVSVDLRSREEALADQVAGA